SIVYNGNTYAASTVLRDTVKSYQGCDSIYNTVNITINPLTPTTKTQTLSSCKSIVYNGNTYAVSTVLRDTVKSTKGCDSVYNIVSISINPIIVIVKTANYTGCGSVNYKNVLYTTSISFFDTIKNLQGCDSIYNINNIVVYPLPKIIVGGNLLVMPNSSVVLNPSISNAISISFTPSKYLDDSTSSNPICTPLSDQAYLIKATSIDGCTETSSLKIFIVKPVSIPNIFSPNGDGINDTWDIAHITDYPFATISIFNRQGQLLKSATSKSIKVWDGTYNGQPVPIAVYYWIIKLTPSSEPMSGIVTVLR
ncbi:MAG: gliding motility-associated C-terminal domain-containing protein, partial [Bacteroidetes bacterium]|nr:gliding motility-associated C-terminal domain-containing protein [Bacteroidota bacterium]